MGFDNFHSVRNRIILVSLCIRIPNQVSSVFAKQDPAISFTACAFSGETINSGIQEAVFEPDKTGRELERPFQRMAFAEAILNFHQRVR